LQNNDLLLIIYQISI